MFAPRLYKIRKIQALEIFENDFVLEIKNEDYSVSQQDNMMFRLIRGITHNNSDFIPYIIFVDCHGSIGKKENIRKLVLDGFIVNNEKFVISERSASMTRNAILGFINEKIENKINKAITMDINLDKTVLSKWCAYRGLMFSSCHCIENWIPKFIVVEDYEVVLKNQKIKWLVEENRKYKDNKTGEDKIWNTYGIEEGKKDLKINVFDGHGFIHPEIAKQIKDYIGIEENPTTMMLRAPFIKGLISQVDYTSYYKDNGIDFIQDIWGKWHSVEDKMIILTKSMYKGFKYFKRTGTYADWDNYWSKFKKYNHCFGIAKWNFSVEQEPVYVRGNYQILQDLDLPFDEFKQLADVSMKWAENVVNGNPFYTYCFLGLNGNSKDINSYAKAIKKNPEMMKEQSVRRFLIRQTHKYIDKMKCGKIYLRACYKFIIPDIIMMLQWIGGNKNPNGSLKEDEFWSYGYKNGKEYLIERNPHICKSEHLVLKNTENDEITKYCGHLVNTCMLNCKSPSPQRMNGADFDGDLVLLIDDDRMIAGVDKECAIVLNLDEKMTAVEEEVTKEHIANLVERTLVSLIGETSNAATCYHNKPWKLQKSKDRYDKNVDVLSIVNSFAIDFAKTGYIMNIPYDIAKYSKPYPYFMRYVSDYYQNLYTSMERTKSVYRFQKSYCSNMNRMAMLIEKWHNNEIKWKKCDKFDYTIMLNPYIKDDNEKFEKINKIFCDFKKECSYLTRFQIKLHNYEKYKNELQAWDKQSAMNYYINWDTIYSKYKKECEFICPNKNELANIVVKICYELNPRSNMKKFIWAVASEGVIENIKQVDVCLPERNPDGNFEYLGKKYDMVKQDCT